MNNIEALRTELSTLYESLKTGKVEAKVASEMTNITGKMIASAKAQLEYYALRKESPNIPFLDSSAQASAANAPPEVKCPLQKGN